MTNIVVSFVDWGLDILGDGVNPLVLGLRINRGNISSERSIVLEPWNLIVSSLVAILALRFVSIVVGLSGDNLRVELAFPSKHNFLAKLASLKVRSIFRLNVIVNFGDQLQISGVLAN